MRVNRYQPSARIDRARKTSLTGSVPDELSVWFLSLFSSNSQQSSIIRHHAACHRDVSILLPPSRQI